MRHTTTCLSGGLPGVLRVDLMLELHLGDDDLQQLVRVAPGAARRLQAVAGGPRAGGHAAVGPVASFPEKSKLFLELCPRPMLVPAPSFGALLRTKCCPFVTTKEVTFSVL